MRVGASHEARHRLETVRSASTYQLSKDIFSRCPPRTALNDGDLAIGIEDRTPRLFDGKASACTQGNHQLMRRHRHVSQSLKTKLSIVDKQRGNGPR